jgi:hypothetical protein
MMSGAIRWPIYTLDGTLPLVPDSITQPQLRNLYRYISATVTPLGVRIESLIHHSYQEVYMFVSDTGRRCTLRLTYDKRFLVTRIEPTAEGDQILADELCRALTLGFHFTDPVQKVLYEIVTERLNSNAVLVEGIEHHHHQEVYYLGSSAGAVRLDIHHDGDGFVTRLRPTAYTTPAALEAVRLALGF